MFRIIALQVTSKNYDNVLDTISELSKNDDRIDTVGNSRASKETLKDRSDSMGNALSRGDLKSNTPNLSRTSGCVPTPQKNLS